MGYWEKGVEVSMTGSIIRGEVLWFYLAGNDREGMLYSVGGGPSSASWKIGRQEIGWYLGVG